MPPEPQPNQDRPKGLRVNKHLVFLEVISAFFAGLATAAILGTAFSTAFPWDWRSLLW
jgi:hypothetical protein